MQAAVVMTATDVVVNIIIADAATDPAPSGCFLVDVTNNANCGIGWVYNPSTQTFTNPNPPPPDPTPVYSSLSMTNTGTV